jgi:hypothetical protein
MSFLLRRYAHVYDLHPYSAAFATCLIKGAIADAMAQLQVEQKQTLDRRRTALFALWSAAYCGSAQHFIFNRLFGRIFGEGTGTMTALRKACADAFVATPLLGIPIYYLCKPLIFTGEWRPLAGLEEYASIFRSFYLKPAMVWVPAHVITFSIIPRPLRIGWTATISLGWLSFVSFTANRQQGGQQQATGDDGDAGGGCGDLNHDRGAAQGTNR